ncbi:UNVERIFIED_CONTAM: hypothetical protein Sradi_6824500 [Sesamum radiatum]|uniref:Uncharacterized protein n=1 Tax=Sesamum radiatum TaxID=300843 RepID=A0AAW2JSZ3_SESRA
MAHLWGSRCWLYPENNSCARSMVSLIEQSGIKSFCIELTNWSRRGHIRCTMIFIMALYRTLQQEISLKYATIAGDFTFGISASNVALICFRSLPLAKNSKTARIISSPIICHAVL